MGFFDKAETSESEETQPSSPWGAQLNSAVADVRKAGVGRKGRAKADESNREKEGSGGSVSQETARKLAKMFEPEKWKPIVRAPFNLMKVKTGRACWTLDEKETETLAETTSAAAEHFMAIDPKWLVLTLLLFNWTVIVVDKAGQNAKEAADEQKSNPKPSPTTAPILVRS
jgi:hypothetical protein